MAEDAVDTLLARAGGRLGPFRLLQRLGEGGFAPVYLADEVYGESVLRKVAVKVFAAPRVAAALGGGTDARVRASLVEEARALCRVEHPNVVRFYQIAEDEDGRLLGLAMELVRGTSVAATLDRARTLDVARALDVGVAVASALAAVHKAGLVHRDVKPQNVVESDGVYKLIDFGIAARGVHTAVVSDGKVPVSVPAALALSIGQGATLDIGAGETTPGGDSSGYTLAGTMGYIDPVCLVHNGIATASSDLYALGCMLFECLAGRLPASVSAEQPDKLAAVVVHGIERAPSLASVAPGVPDSLAALVDSLIAPDRESRPRSTEWVVAELERICLAERGRATDLPSEDEGPFRGLERFESRHRGVFLGRSAELSSALGTLRAQGLLAVVGPSGSGKSSLARAAILPAIEEGALGGWPASWDAVSASPGADAAHAIRAALAKLVDVAAAGDDPDALVRALLERVDRTGRGVVLLVDQLEELVTQGSPAARRYTVRLLARIAERPLPGVRVVVAVRRDFLDPLFGEEELGRALGRGLLLVSPLTPLVWRGILDEGLRSYRYTIDADARGEILEELKLVGDAMPLVQFALSQLWARRDRTRRHVPRAALVAIGGVSGALDLHAERVVRGLETRLGQHAHDSLRRVCLLLTSPQGTRVSLTRAALVARARDPRAPEVLDSLEASRLVTREGDALAFTHDAVLVAWRRLAWWIKAARGDRELAAELEGEAARWSRARERELLWAKRRLAEARELLARGTVEVTDGARAFVRAARRAELRKIGGGIALGVSLAAGVALAGGLYADSTARAARNKEHIETVQRDLLERRAAAFVEANEMIVQLRAERDACKRAADGAAGDGRAQR